MVRNSERVKFIRLLRVEAKACGVDHVVVQRVDDNAGRSKVEEMMQKIRDSSGPAASKAAAEKAWGSYLKTFEDEQRSSRCRIFENRSQILRSKS